MNTALIDAAPDGDFEEISIQMPEWVQRFETLVNEGKRIRFDVYEMPTIPQKIKRAMERKGYVDLILKTNHDLHFFVIKGNPSN